MDLPPAEFGPRPLWTPKKPPRIVAVSALAVFRIPSTTSRSFRGGQREGVDSPCSTYHPNADPNVRAAANAGGQIVAWTGFPRLERRYVGHSFASIMFVDSVVHVSGMQWRDG